MNRPTPDEIEALRSVPFLDTLSPEDLARVATIGRRRRYDPETTVVEKGSYGGGLFVVLDGAATVEAGGTVHRLGPGEFFGEMSLLSRKPRSATVTAAEPLEALVIDTVDFKAFLMKNHSLTVAILERVVERLREVQQRVEAGLAGAPAPEESASGA